MPRPLPSVNGTMAPIPEMGTSPYHEEQVHGPWRMVVRSDVGLARGRMEDAWSICLDTEVNGRRYHAVAVFDGLGGLPRGQEAAWAAADRLGDALRHAPHLDDVLPRLNRVVRETGGATTAVVALLDTADPGHGELLCVGDSAAYALDKQNGLRILNVKDSVAPHVLSDFLGNVDLKGHRVPFRIAKGGALVLCTDGVDGVADAARLDALLTRNGDLHAVDALFEEINARGAPDNATLLVAYLE